MTLLHQNNLYLQHKYRICDTKNDSLSFLPQETGTDVLKPQIKKVKDDRLIFKSDYNSSNINTKITELGRDGPLLGDTFYIYGSR